VTATRRFGRLKRCGTAETRKAHLQTEKDQWLIREKMALQRPKAANFQTTDRKTWKPPKAIKSQAWYKDASSSLYQSMCTIGDTWPGM